MVLRLRANALALAKVQLAMVALLRSEPPEPAADSPAAPDHASVQRPEEIIRLAVRGMMPRNRLARKQITKLKIYAGPEHPHTAQRPETLEIDA